MPLAHVLRLCPAPLRWPLAALALCLPLLSACGGGGDPPPLPPPGKPTPPPPPPAPPADTIALDPSLTPLVAGTANSLQYFPAGGSGTGQPIDGVQCAPAVHYHVHGMISFYHDGLRLGIPQHIGLNGCAYEMHTHDPTTGVVHIETDGPKTFVLRQFFSLWGQPLSRAGTAGLAGPVRFYLIENGKLSLYTGDPNTIELGPHREVVIVTGTAPATVPQYDWAGSNL